MMGEGSAMCLKQQSMMGSDMAWCHVLFTHCLHSALALDCCSRYEALSVWWHVLLCVYHMDVCGGHHAVRICGLVQAVSAALGAWCT